jgi:hypothetical protein
MIFKQYFMKLKTIKDMIDVKAKFFYNSRNNKNLNDK